MKKTCSQIKELLNRFRERNSIESDGTSESNQPSNFRCKADTSFQLKTLLKTTGAILLLVAVATYAYRLNKNSGAVFLSIESFIGPLSLFLLAIGTVVCAVAGRYRGAAGLLAVTLGVFVLRSISTTFYNDTRLARDYTTLNSPVIHEAEVLKPPSKLRGRSSSAKEVKKNFERSDDTLFDDLDFASPSSLADLEKSPQSEILRFSGAKGQDSPVQREPLDLRETGQYALTIDGLIDTQTALAARKTDRDNFSNSLAGKTSAIYHGENIQQRAGRPEGQVGGGVRGKNELNTGATQFDKRKAKKQRLESKGYSGTPEMDEEESYSQVRSERRQQADQKIVKDQGNWNPDKNGISPASFARAYLSQREQVEGIQFQPPTGYWLSTYIPGDPKFRALFTKFSRSIENSAGEFSDKQLESLASQPSQPFDSPQNSALATFIHSDTPYLEGTKRMVVQVGIKATEKRAGTRPAMNIAVVLDLRAKDRKQIENKVRALVNAFQKSKDIGDKFSLVVAGQNGGMLITPENFRHGPIQIALEKLFRKHRKDSKTFSLHQALESASTSLLNTDDPSSPLGSSAIVLVTSQQFNPLPVWLGRFAHQSAVSGIPVSTVALNDAQGKDLVLSGLDKIALAGQGRRRILLSSADAKHIVDSELQAVSNVVARAVRLRIRLAPGSRLVGIFGSKRLTPEHSAQIKEAEKSIDLRLSKNLGIEADRGDDEEGIQIVIPAFYAGDAHTVLLDVVSSGPGPIADVTARYKDLVYLRNGITRSTLSLGRLRQQTGPLELNVLKNLLAFELSSSLLSAGQNLRNQNSEKALNALHAYLALQDLVMQNHRSLERDTELGRDRLMLSQYVSLIQNSRLSPSPNFQNVAESLHVAGTLKVNPEPIAIN